MVMRIVHIPDNSTARDVQSSRPRIRLIKPAVERWSAVGVEGCFQPYCAIAMRRACQKRGLLSQLSFIRYWCAALILTVTALAVPKAAFGSIGRITTVLNSSVGADEVSCVKTYAGKKSARIEPLESRVLLAAVHGLSASYFNGITPGSGLGLALVAAIARLHEASLELDDAHPGLLVRIRFRARAGATLGNPNVLDSAL